MEVLEKDGFHPGAARFGNFINYYEFNPPGSRLKLLSSDVIMKLCCHSKFVVLDIGCNTGEMTTAIYKHLQAAKAPSSGHEVNILGIDIDPILIERANENNHVSHITYLVCDVMNEKCAQQLTGYLSGLNRPMFDIGFCLSTTMWIHLNHGDEGLVKFLRWMSSMVKYLVIEPQPWKCYKSAARRMRRLGQDDFLYFSALKFRENVIEDVNTILTGDCEMRRVALLGESQWKRPVLLYEKAISSR